MKNIWLSIKKNPQNSQLILIVACLYVLNNNYFKSNTDGILQYFMICYFNDLIAPILLLSYANILLISINYELKQVKWIILLGIGAGLFWEFSAPLFKTSSTTDINDLYMYTLGSFLYWCIVYGFRKQKQIL